MSDVDKLENFEDKKEEKVGVYKPQDTEPEPEYNYEFDD